jgi:HK97 family phage prohead protease
MIERIEIKSSLSVNDAGEVSGIAWPFGSADRVGDIITKGAFNVGEDVPMLFGHDPEDVIGLWDSVTETDDGLQVKGNLFVKEHPRARAVRSLIIGGLIGGLSIGFRTKSATKRPTRGRVISALDLLEVSIVRNPSHPKARITSAKSASTEIRIAEALNRAALALRS